MKEEQDMVNNEPVDVSGAVQDFHVKFKHPVRPCCGLASPVDMKFRQERITEEARELAEAIESGDLIRIAGEAIDLIYVTLGLLLICGIPFYAVFRAVQKANMAKVYAPPVDGIPQKPIKPEGWKKPDREIWKVLNAQRFGAVTGTFPASSSQVTVLGERPGGARLGTKPTKASRLVEAEVKAPDPALDIIESTLPKGLF